MQSQDGQEQANAGHVKDKDGSRVGSRSHLMGGPDAGQSEHRPLESLEPSLAPARLPVSPPVSHVDAEDGRQPGCHGNRREHRGDEDASDLDPSLQQHHPNLSGASMATTRYTASRTATTVAMTRVGDMGR